MVSPYDNLLIIASVMAMRRLVKASCVGLRKQQIGRAFNLHKLSTKGAKAGWDDIFVQGDLKRGQPGQPMPLKLADDVANGRFVNDGLLRHDGFHAAAGQMGLKDLDLVFEKDRRIRDQPIGSQRVGPATSLTDDSVYFEALTSQRDLDLPGVIAMADQIPASTAGAAKLVEGNLLDELVVGPLVVPLGKLVAFWKVNSYHNIAPRIGVP